MHITFVLAAALDSPYGQGRIVPMARELARRGHTVTLLALHYDWQRCTARQISVPTEGAPITVHYGGQMAVRKREGVKTYFRLLPLLGVLLTGFFGLVRAGLSTKTDVWHVGKPQPVNGLAGWLLSRLTRRPLYVDCDDYEAVMNHFMNPLQRRGVALVEDWLPRHARGITTHTTFLANRYRSLGYPAERIMLVPNGLPALPEEGAPLPPILQALQLRLGNAPVVLYVGTLTLSGHPVDLLLSAFAQVAAQDEYVQLVIVGSGVDEQVLRQQAATLPCADRIHFTGWLDAETALLAYRLATVTVDPVLDNDVARARCPLKLMESLAMGKPIVTGDVGDRALWLGTVGQGWLVAPGSAEALSEGLTRVLSQSWDSKTIQAQAANFDWQRLGDQWEQVYNQR